MCHLWPAIAPHGAEVPTSVWNLPYGTWLGLARAASQYEQDMKEASRR